MKGISEFSRQIPGTRGNYHWPVRFDILDGYVGISQLHPTGGQWERVLLSPHQVTALVKFLAEKKAGLKLDAILSGYLQSLPASEQLEKIKAAQKVLKNNKAGLLRRPK